MTDAPRGVYALRARTLDEVAESLTEPGAMLLAGGQSLLPRLRSTPLSQGLLVDLSGVEALRQCTLADGWIRLGSTMTHSAIARSRTILENAPRLAAIAGLIGDEEVRNRGTLGGALREPHPRSDWAACLTALDTTLEVIRPGDGRSTVPLRDYLSNDDLRNEVHLIVEARLRPEALASFHYERQAGDAAGGPNCSIAVSTSYDGVHISKCNIVVTGAAPRTFIATASEEALCGTTATKEHVDAAAALLCDGVTLLDDSEGDPKYRAHLIGSRFTTAIRELLRTAP